MPDDPYTPAELDAARQAILQVNRSAVTPTYYAEAALRAVLPDHDARVRTDERARVAGEIRAHADRHAPAGYPLNHPRTVLRRHLLTAARVAEGPLTDADVAEIGRAGGRAHPRHHTHHRGEPDEPWMTPK